MSYLRGIRGMRLPLTRNTSEEGKRDRMRITAMILAAATALCCVSCGKSSSSSSEVDTNIVGMWSISGEGADGGYIFEDNGTASVYFKPDNTYFEDDAFFIYGTHVGGDRLKFDGDILTAEVLNENFLTLDRVGEPDKTTFNGDYVITKTNYYKLVRDAAMNFERLPVDAGGRFEDRFMDSLEPFDQSQIQPFDMRYLAGFTADRFDQKKTDITERAEKRMRYSALNLIGQKAVSGYGTATRTGGWFHTDLDAKYILFPVYMFDISHAGKNYHFAVNGQTGKVVGDLPDDSGVSSMYFLKRFGLVTGGLILFSVAKYMLGM